MFEGSHKNDDIKKASKELEELNAAYQIKFNEFNTLYQKKIKYLEEAPGQQILDIDIYYNEKQNVFKTKDEKLNHITVDIDDYIDNIEESLVELDSFSKGDR